MSKKAQIDLLNDEIKKVVDETISEWWKAGKINHTHQPADSAALIEKLHNTAKEFLKEKK